MASARTCVTLTHCASLLMSTFLADGADVGLDDGLDERLGLGVGAVGRGVLKSREGEGRGDGLCV